MLITFNILVDFYSSPQNMLAKNAQTKKYFLDFVFEKNDNKDRIIKT